MPPLSSAGYGLMVSIPTICQTLHYMGCTRQALKYIAIQRSEEDRAKSMAEIFMYNSDMIIWLDETRCDWRHSTRKWSYGIHTEWLLEIMAFLHGVRDALL